MAKKQEKAGTSVSTNTKPSEKKGNTKKVPSVAEVISFCRRLGLQAELVGRWVWVTFAEKPDDAMRKTLKDFGFRWSIRRRKWAHNCGNPTKSAKKSNPWQKYQHRVISPKGQG